MNEDFAAHLQQVIDGKNAKAPAYRAKCDECWLVVVADWRGPSAFFEMSDKMSDDSYNTVFDRVYFVAGYSGRVVALNAYSNGT